MNKKGVWLSPDLVSAPPSLSGSLVILYNGLDKSNKSIFLRVYRLLWGAVLPFRRLGGPLGSVSFYWAVDLARVRLGLTTSELSLLSYIFHLSGNGVNYVHSRVIYGADLLPSLVRASVTGVLNDLKLKGYIIRSSRDMNNKYRSVARGVPWIKLTNKGINTITGMEADIYHLLLNTSLDDLTGNKKPGV